MPSTLSIPYTACFRNMSFILPNGSPKSSRDKKVLPFTVFSTCSFYTLKRKPGLAGKAAHMVYKAD